MAVFGVFLFAILHVAGELAAAVGGERAALAALIGRQRQLQRQALGRRLSLGWSDGREAIFETCLLGVL